MTSRLQREFVEKWKETHPLGETANAFYSKEEEKKKVTK